MEKHPKMVLFTVEIVVNIYVMKILLYLMDLLEEQPILLKEIVNEINLLENFSETDILLVKDLRRDV